VARGHEAVGGCNETLKLATDDRRLSNLTLARADKHNAMSAQMIDD